MNLRAVNTGSHKCSCNKDNIREGIDICGSAGDPIIVSLACTSRSCSVHGISVGEEKMEGRWSCWLG